MYEVAISDEALLFQCEVDDLPHIYCGTDLEFLASLPSESVDMIVTSPPYNLQKAYDSDMSVANYLAWQHKVIVECWRVLKSTGNVCWQVGNYIEKGPNQKSAHLFPLDILLFPVFTECGFNLRNRIIWHYGHGLHCKNRFSGRYETIMWFTKSEDYYFNVDPVRVPQKYPKKKYFRGPKKGQYSCNPLGKSPGDVWMFSNVKNNHPEKTIHPCQFPVEMIERLLLSMTKEGDFIVDPYVGSGTSLVAAMLNRRRSSGSDTMESYCRIASQRIIDLLSGSSNIKRFRGTEARAIQPC